MIVNRIPSQPLHKVDRSNILAQESLHKQDGLFLFFFFKGPQIQSL